MHTINSCTIGMQSKLYTSIRSSASNIMSMKTSHMCLDMLNFTLLSYDTMIDSIDRLKNDKNLDPDRDNFQAIYEVFLKL